MQHRSTWLTVAILACAPLPALAAGAAHPDHGFYVGAGASLNGVKFGQQDIFAIGTSDTYSGSTLVATGKAAGPATLYPDSKTSAGLNAQLGYFKAFSGSEWLWGGKLNYAWLNSSTSLPDALLPQYGAYTPTGGTPVPFTGTAVVRTYKTQIDSQISLVPYIGRSVGAGFLYAGIGPSLSRTQTYLDGLVGFADLTGQPSDISGMPQNFSASSWVWGANIVAGGTVFLAPTWFLDINYSYGQTGSHTSHYNGTFTNEHGPNGTTNSGTLVGESTGKVITNSLIFTINKLF
jgi:hypothetical protein